MSTCVFKYTLLTNNHDRCPVILCKAIDHLHRERNVVGRELGEESREGVKKVVEELSKLRLAVAFRSKQALAG